MANPILGALYPAPYLPKSKQPGGPGTPVVDPTQTVEEKNGYYYPGCGHSVNSYDVQQTSVNGIPSKLVTCPICGFLQAIITPASDFDNIPGILQA
jgi:hypothetical protein